MIWLVDQLTTDHHFVAGRALVKKLFGLDNALVYFLGVTTLITRMIFQAHGVGSLHQRASVLSKSDHFALVLGHRCFVEEKETSAAELSGRGEPC